MWTRSAKQADGTFNITVWNNDGSVYLQEGGFTSATEADYAAEYAQRRVLFGEPECTWNDVFAEMEELGL